MFWRGNCTGCCLGRRPAGVWLRAISRKQHTFRISVGMQGWALSPT
jgi:hypothetical protein